MVKKGTILALIAGVLLVVLSPGIGLSKQETVKIGLMLPFSGDMALFGNKVYKGAELARTIINERGGLFGGKKIEWVKGDAIDPKAAASEAERLINTEGLKLITGTFASSCSFAATAVAERYGVFYWEGCGTADGITTRGFKYTFRPSVAQGLSFAIVGDFVKDMVARDLGTPANQLTAAIIYEDTLWGTNGGKFNRKHLERVGVKTVGDYPYSRKAVDLSSLIMKLKADKPDILSATSYMTDAILFHKQMRAMNFNVKAFIGSGSGHSEEAFSEALGPDANYVCTSEFPVRINPDAINKDVNPSLKEYRRRFQAMWGYEPTAHDTIGYNSWMVLFGDVLPRAGSLDPDAVRKAAIETDIPIGGTVFGWGVKFAPPGHEMAGTNLRGFTPIHQWIDGKLLCVYPERFATGKYVSPFPTWEERKAKK